MAMMKMLSLAIFETPKRCEDCPCVGDDYCQLQAYIDHTRVSELAGRKKPIPEWCPLKPVVFEDGYAK